MTVLSALAVLLLACGQHSTSSDIVPATSPVETHENPTANGTLPGEARFPTSVRLPTARLAGMTGTLVSLNGKAPLEEYPVTITFTGGELSGHSGCNSYGGRYKADNGKIWFPSTEGVWMTAMGCMGPKGAPLMEQESQFHRLINDVTEYHLVGERLELMDSGGQIVLVFRRDQ